MLDFQNATLLSYNHTNKFGGGELFRLGSVKELTVRGFLKSKTENKDLEGVKEAQTKIQDFIDLANDWEDIRINNHNFGKGRVTSLDFLSSPDTFTDHIRFAEFEATIEIPSSTNGDELYNLRGETYRGILSAIDRTSSALQDFDESFSFEIEEDNGYSYSHDLTINFISGVLPEMITSGARYDSNKEYFIKNLESDEECSFTQGASESLRRIDTSADIISSDGNFIPTDTSAIDIALSSRIGSTASSSSYSSSYLPANAIDIEVGDPVVETDFVAKTKDSGEDNYQWWEIDLGCNVYDLTKVVIRNRDASASTKLYLNNFRISVFEEGYTKSQNVTAAVLATSYAKYLTYSSDHYDTDDTYPDRELAVSLPAGVYGRYLRVQWLSMTTTGGGTTRIPVSALGFSNFELYSSRSVVKVYNSESSTNDPVKTSVKLIKTNPIAQSKKAARRIFETRPALGFIDAKYSGYYQTTGQSFFSETYDLSNHTCSFTKNLKFAANTGDKYSVSRSHSLEIAENGIATITEEGSVKGRIKPFFSSAREGAETEINNSYSRVTGIFSGYCAGYNNNAWFLPWTSDSEIPGHDNLGSGINHGPSGMYQDIFDRPIDISRSYASGESRVDYSVKYSNNPRITGQYQFDRSVSFSKNEENILSVVEAGDIKPYFSKRFKYTQTNPNNVDDPYGLKSFYKQKEHKIKERCERAYSQYLNRIDYLSLYHKGLTLEPVSTKLSHQAYGKSLTYTKTFSDDKTIVDTNNLKSFSLDFSDSPPIYSSKDYIIPRFGVVFNQKGNYATLGKRTVSCRGTYKRLNTSNILKIYEGGNYVTSNLLSVPNLMKALNYMRGQCVTKAREVWADYGIDPGQHPTFHVSDMSYSFGSDRSLTLSMDFVFTGSKAFNELAYRDGGINNWEGNTP